MPADPKCPNPNCPVILRRAEDTGIQAVLAAIDSMNSRVIRIDQNINSISASVAVHESKINDIKDSAKNHGDKRWVLIVASVGLAPTVVTWVIKIVQKF